LNQRKKVNDFKTVAKIGFAFFFLINRTKLSHFTFIQLVFIKLYFLYKRKIEGNNLSNLHKELPKDAVIVDVGANIGWFTHDISKFLNVDSKIITIEPDALNLKILQYVVKNKCKGKNIQIEACAASGENEHGYLRIDKVNPANHRVIDCSDF
jgi:hypothetical protein